MEEGNKYELTFTSDGYPNLKMTKQALAAKEDLVGHYMGRVRGIIKIDVTSTGDATVDTTIDVIGQTKIDCSAENTAETDSLVTCPDAPTVGDCVGDGIRTDGKDPTKYTTIIKNDDGTSTVDTTIDVISQTKIDCSAEKIAETDSLVTFPDAPTVLWLPRRTWLGTTWAVCAASSRSM